MEIRIYFEGAATLRGGFEAFFSDLRTAALEAQCELHMVSAKDGISAYRKAARSHPSAWNILLKDSEEPIPTDVLALLQRHGIDSALSDRVFWMVQLMEAWFLADPEALEVYYGKAGFSSKAVGGTQNVETVPKSEVLRRLKAATKDTSKGAYNKVRHAPRLLELLDAGRVRERAPRCRRLVFEILAKLEIS
jgi:hypothetical protein